MRAIAFLLAGVVVSNLAQASSEQRRDPKNRQLALVGATIWVSPSEGPIRDGVVLVSGQTIAGVGEKGKVQVPHDARVINCAGMTITAGFWNSHVHFYERKWANAADVPAAELEQQLQDMVTRYGFTTVFDLSSPWENTRTLRNRIDSGEVRGPKIYSTGPGLMPWNAGIPELAITMMGWMKSASSEVADPAQAAAVSRQLLDAGVDGIKLFISSPSRSTLSEATVAAAVDEAHRRHKPVFVHPNTAADVLAAVRAGADVIAHTTPQTGSWDETLVAAMKERKVALIPTLWIWRWYARHDRRSAQDRVIQTETGQLHAWVEAGGTVLFGTDLGAVDPDPGEEYALMSQAGMSFRQILASLTTAPAERFGVADKLGRIAAGQQADLVVLKHDPAEDIRALTEVTYTIRGGEVIYAQ